MSKKPKRQILKEQKLNTILLETYEAKNEVIAGSPVIGSFEVAITESGAKNANGRVYPKEVWTQPDSFQPGGKYLDENGKLRPLSLLGYADHPTENQLEVLLEKAAIAYSELTLEENIWKGKVNILNTPGGKIVKTFLDYAKEFGGGDQIGVSTRADGSTTIVESAGDVYEQVEPEGFYLAAIDFVYNPSSFVANSPTLLENKKRNRTLLENIQKLAKEDEEHKQEYIDFINKMKQDLSESASLDRAKQAYLKDLKEQEYKLHQAIYEIENMDNEAFTQANISETLTRDQFLIKIKKEHRKLINEIDKEEGLLEEMNKDKTTKTTKETLNENTEDKKYIIQEVQELISERHNDLDDRVFLKIKDYLNTVVFPEMGEDEIIEMTEDKDSIHYLAQKVEEAIVFENLTEQTLNEETKDDNEELEDNENNEDNNEDDNEEIEDDAENGEDELEDTEEVEDDKDIEEEDKIDLEAIMATLNDLTMKIDTITDWLFEIDDVELTHETSGVEQVENDLDNNEDEEELDITEEDLEYMTDEELEALYQLAGEEVLEENKNLNTHNYGGHLYDEVRAAVIHGDNIDKDNLNLVLEIIDETVNLLELKNRNRENYRKEYINLLNKYDKGNRLTSDEKSKLMRMSSELTNAAYDAQWKLDNAGEVA